MMKRRIAVIGLGIIGSVWARNWQADGHAVRSWNRSPKPDAPGFTSCLQEAVADAEIIALVLADGPVTAALLEDMLPHLSPAAVICQHATIAVDETQALARRVHERGLAYLDMPFTGSQPAAEQRQTVFFVGDDDQSFERVAEVYRPLSKACIQLGGVGGAATIKLAMNLTIAATYQALAESLALVRAAGLDEESYWQVLDLNVARSGLVDLKAEKMRQADWRPQFSVKHLHKDLSLALRLAQTVDRQLPQTQRLQETYAQRIAAGDGELDFAALLRAVDPHSA